MTDGGDGAGHTLRAALGRGAALFGCWVILSGTDPVDLAAGVPTAAVATWVSLRLLPPRPGGVRPGALAALVLRFLYQSVRAGVDVAWRALDPRLPVRPGFVAYRTRLAPGPARDGFCTVTSLLPGTLPSGADADGRLIVHCLDVTEPMAEQLAAEEARLTGALGGANGHG